ncbi:HK97 family phage prohead protease, partial [Streptomyces sp. NEAU-H3]|uniref:HK97 family phage prohead protease n=1 Tax=Streptomyces sp. NEAU-H3 TaxID=2720636 RepID=UPI001ADBEB0F
VGLYVKGRLLVEADPLAKRAHGHMKAGSLTGLSIGYMLEDGGYDYDKEKGIWLLKAIDLWEVSPVTFPANDEARITDVKSLLAREPFERLGFLAPKPRPLWPRATAQFHRERRMPTK